MSRHHEAPELPSTPESVSRRLTEHAKQYPPVDITLCGAVRPASREGSALPDDPGQYDAEPNGRNSGVWKPAIRSTCSAYFGHSDPGVHAPDQHAPAAGQRRPHPSRDRPRLR